MNFQMFKILLIAIIVGFTAFFLLYFLPPIIKNPDIIGVLEAGFVNTYATGYSIDLISCWLLLIVFVLYESKALSIKYGWICILLGLTPGVVVGWAAYLLLRYNQLKK